MARPQKALVVDDLAVNRLILGTILQKLGFEVLEAENGLQCIDVVTQERTQLVCVFLDLQMPVADGWTATRGIRELESRTPDRDRVPVPVVVCTASCLDDLVDNGQTVAQRAVSLGANGAVRKPLTIYAVQSILDQYAPQWRSARGHEGPAPATAYASADIEPFTNSTTTTTTNAGATNATTSISSHASSFGPGCVCPTPKSFNPAAQLRCVQCLAKVQQKQRVVSAQCSQSSAEEAYGGVVGARVGCAGFLSRSCSAEPQNGSRSGGPEHKAQENGAVSPPTAQAQRRMSYDVACFPTSLSSLSTAAPSPFAPSASWVPQPSGTAPALMSVLPHAVVITAAAQ